MKDKEDKAYRLSPLSGAGVSFKDSGWVDCGNGAKCREVRGLVETPHGFVRVFSSRWSRPPEQDYPPGFSEHSKGPPLHTDYTNLEIIIGGLVFTRSIEKFYGQRYLVTLAKRLARDVKNGRFAQ